MSAEIIDGKAFAARLGRGSAAEVARADGAGTGWCRGSRRCWWATIRRARSMCATRGGRRVEAGMHSEEHRLERRRREAELLALIGRLNRDPAIHGILVQLPLPAQIDEARVVDAVAPEKDVDGFHVVERRAARLRAAGDGALHAARLPDAAARPARRASPGCEAVVLGRSNIVGRPMAQLLLREDCTVTIAHSRTRDLAAVCARADILVAAVGRPGMVTGDWVKPGATVIDVGINRVPGPDGQVDGSSATSTSPAWRRSRARSRRCRAGSGR